MRPFLVALAGPSGSGKSNLASALCERLGPDFCTRISLDSYYKDLAHLSPDERAAVNFDQPSALDAAGLAADLETLCSGRPARIPVYDFASHTRSAEAVLHVPRPILLVEGLFAIALEPASCPFDLKIYVEVDPEICLARRLARDVVQRGRDEAGVRDAFERHVRPSLAAVIEPQKSLAHLVLDGTRPEQDLLEACLKSLPKPEDPPEGLPVIFSRLASRTGKAMLAERLSLQSTHWAGMHHQGEGLLMIERVVPLDTLVEFFLRFSGLSFFGRRGARDLRVERNPVRARAVPKGLAGFRILQLSDLHLDLQTGVMPRLLEAISSLDYDLAVITGDFRNSTVGDFEDSLRETARVVQAIKSPVFGILGNHDFVEMVPRLEEIGLPILLNETISFVRNGARLVVAGIDDPHFYKTHDIPRVGITPPGSDVFRILLSHSPETFEEASAHFDFMMSGHTHGGQLCLPGGIPIIRNGRCPRRMLSGPWTHKGLLGYTSRGTGCCGVAARIFCPPEITVHTLEPADS